MRNFLYLLAVFLFSACSLKPNLIIPEVSYTIKEDNISISKEWWKEFGDEKLNSLVEEALKNSTDLRIAFIRFEQAAETLGMNRSDLFPKLDGSVNGTRAKTSINAPTNQTNHFTYNNDFKMGLNLSYEVDLWGKYRDNYSASVSALKASEFDFENARISLIANVVQMYFNTANAYENMEILRQTLDAYSRIYELNLIRYKAGAIGEYELEQSRAELEKTKADYANAILTKENCLKALKILVSNDLDNILYEEQDYKKFGEFAMSLPEGIGSEILLQRPDVRAALKRLMEKNYLVGVARSAFLPSLSLTGLLGFESRDLDTLVKNGSKTWNIGGSFLMPIFHWGEIVSNVNLAKLNKDEAFLNYENTLRTAFGEIRLALVQRKINVQNYQYYKSSLEAQEKIYNLASVRYENGSIPLIEYLDAQRNLLSAKISFVNANYAMANSIVGVIKAFGGGFKESESSSPEIKKYAKSLDSSSKR